MAEFVLANYAALADTSVHQHDWSAKIKKKKVKPPCSPRFERICIQTFDINPKFDLEDNYCTGKQDVHNKRTSPGWLRLQNFLFKNPDLIYQKVSKTYRTCHPEAQTLPQQIPAKRPRVWEGGKCQNDRNSSDRRRTLPETPHSSLRGANRDAEYEYKGLIKTPSDLISSTHGTEGWLGQLLWSNDKSVTALPQALR